VVYDPPHIPNQGRDKQKDFNTRFGLVLKSSAHNGYNFSHLYPPFVRRRIACSVPRVCFSARLPTISTIIVFNGRTLNWSAPPSRPASVPATASSRFAKDRSSIQNGRRPITRDVSTATGSYFANPKSASRSADSDGLAHEGLEPLVAW